MLFNTPQFFLFLLVTLSLFYVAPRSWRKPLLLAASYWFYMSWNWRFAPLLLTLTAIDYTAARWIEATADARRRKLLLTVSIAANLGFLGFFKYYNFLAGNAAALLGRPENAFAFGIVLPLGISFHTFQSISYVVDVYRRQQKAIRSVLDYALFIAFFPQLVAGPIVRAHAFFKDLYNWCAPSGEELNRGALLVLFGLTKKMALADPFSLIADRYFSHLAAHPGVLPAWSGVLAFAVQIYFDFSGYTDMAIGMALLMGFHFPVNFRRPYLAAGIADFWRRWHMSLSSWLRDYLYIALGGNRRGRVRTYLNLMATMLLVPRLGVFPRRQPARQRDRDRPHVFGAARRVAVGALADRPRPGNLGAGHPGREIRLVRAAGEGSGVGVRCGHGAAPAGPGTDRRDGNCRPVRLFPVLIHDVGHARGTPGMRSTVSVQTAKTVPFVGRLAKLRAGWQLARAAIANRRAGCHPAPRKSHPVKRSQY
jgi:D-alanyl-lipoteichoic acid acyltransferase DltB (MBOAT superfamily)